MLRRGIAHDIHCGQPAAPCLALTASYPVLRLLLPRALRYLKHSDTCWQPADLLPESSDPDFLDQVGGLCKDKEAVVGVRS